MVQGIFRLQQKSLIVLSLNSVKPLSIYISKGMLFTYSIKLSSIR